MKVKPSKPSPPSGKKSYEPDPKTKPAPKVKRDR